MQKNNRKILFLGSGLMAEAVVKYLTRRSQNHIHIASNIVSDAEKLAKKYANCTFGEVDVMKKESLGPLIENSELVISYVPAFLHIHIARLCLEYGKHLVTASYVSPEMQALNEEAKKKDLVFLNELGLDPGIDHLSAMKVIDEIKKQGGKILEFESWCGGLPSAEFCNNPLGYKFTWSPIGAMRAVKNNARYIFEGKEYTVPSKDLLYTLTQVELNPALQLQGYPNRDSVSYQQLYSLQGASKVMRGTLRYKGFCCIIAALKEIGLYSQEPVPKEVSNWVEYLEHLLKDEKEAHLTKQISKSAAEAALLAKIANRAVYSVKHYEDLSEQEKQGKVRKIVEAIRYFRLLDPASKIHNYSNNLESLVHLLNQKLKLGDKETDLIAMQHIFKVQLPNRDPFTRKSSLVLIGDKNGASAMSQSVGIPTAIGAQLVLDGKVKARGVMIPITEELYIPILKDLQQEGIKLVEEDS